MGVLWPNCMVFSVPITAPSHLINPLYLLERTMKQSKNWVPKCREYNREIEKNSNPYYWVYGRGGISEMILTKWQISWWRLYGLQLSYSIVYQEHHGQTPGDMNIQVTVH